MFRLDQGGVHNIECSGCDFSIASGGDAFVVHMEYDHQLTAKVTFRDTAVSIVAGKQAANRCASLAFIQGRPLDADVVLDNVVCLFGGSLNPDYPALHIGKEGNPTLLRRLSIDNSYLVTSSRCVQACADIGMIRLAASKFAGTKGLYLYDTGIGQTLSNIIVAGSSFDCTTCLDFGSRSLPGIDPIVVTGCKFRGAPTNTADNVPLVWANNDVNGTLSTDIDGRYVKKSGDTMTGPLNMGGNSISNVGTLVVADLQAVTQTIVTVTNVSMTASNLTLQGVLDMGGYGITNLGLPTAATMAATKAYVDAATNSTKVTSVSAASPLASSGGATPEISLAGQLSGANITNGAISADKLQDGAVTAAKIADATITSDKLQDGAVTTAKIADATITSNKLGQMDAATGQVLNGREPHGRRARISWTTSRICPKYPTSSCSSQAIRSPACSTWAGTTFPMWQR